MSQFLVARTKLFSVEHARTCGVPGYLIVEPLISVTNLWELPKDAQSALGVLQARCMWAIQEVLCPRRIYCLTFAEETVAYQCHIFPRSDEMTFQYLSECQPRGNLVNGPLFFNWARERYRESASDNGRISDAVRRIRTSFECCAPSALLDENLDPQ